MASLEFPNHINRNPHSPDRKLPVEPNAFATPDRTIGTTGSDCVIDSPAAGDIRHEIDDMIHIVKTYVQAPQGYSPTRNEFERTMEAIEQKAEEEDALRKQEGLEHSVQRQASFQESTFMENIFGAFASFASPTKPAEQTLSSSSTRGTVVHEMLKRLVLQELQSRRDKSATTIQSAVRRLLAQKKRQEMRVIQMEKGRALSELAMLHKYELYNRKAPVADDEEVAEEIKTSKFSKMKTAFQSLKKKKSKSNTYKAPLLLPNTNSTNPGEASTSAQEIVIAGHHDADAPVQEKAGRKSKFWKTVQKIKSKKLARKKKKKKRPQKFRPVLDGVVEEEPYEEPDPRYAVIITTIEEQELPPEEQQLPPPPPPLEDPSATSTNSHRHTPCIYNLDHQEEEPEEEEEPQTQFSLPSSLPSGKEFFRWNNFVLADDATSITSARSRPLLDSWFRQFVFEKDTLKELDDDAIEELVEMVFTSKDLQKDLSLIPEMNWTDDDWVEFKNSIFQCSQEHAEEISYQTKRLIPNEITL